MRDARTHPGPSPLTLPLICSCTPSRSLRLIDRPSFETPLRCSCSSPLGDTCYGGFFSFSLRCASQQAASNCYIFSWQETTAHITSRSAGSVVAGSCTGEKVWTEFCCHEVLWVLFEGNSSVRMIENINSNSLMLCSLKCFVCM